LTFENVNEPGITTVSRVDSAFAASTPANFRLCGSLYEVATSAEYEGHIEVCFSLAEAGCGGPAAAVELWHCDEGNWFKLGEAGPGEPEVCGYVTALSPFALLRTNRPPVARCRDVTVTANTNCVGTVTTAQVNAGSSDPDGDSLTLKIDPPPPYPLGTTTVDLIATDRWGLSNKCSATITVAENPGCTPIEPPRVVKGWLSQGSITLELQAAPATPYRLERNDHLGPDGWSGVGVRTTDATGRAYYTETWEPAATGRFYRAIAP
jgi:hypothetical protein